MSFTPLDGLVVLDLSRYLPGPLLTRVLADLGADVIKIEPPNGDGLRWMPPHVDGIGAGYAALNAGKRSLGLDLKRPEGVAVLEALVPRADVLVETFRPGVLDRLGLGIDALHALNPRLIVASLSGYGQTSSRRDAAGHDLNYVARAGVLGQFGPADGPPVVPGTQIGDIGGGGLLGAIGILGALLERDRTGRGRHLDVSLTRGALSFATFGLANAAAGATAPRGADVLTGGIPSYRCYTTADGRHLSVGALEPKFWLTLCGLLERPDLIGDAYATGRRGAEVTAALEAEFARRPLAAWVALFEGHDVCVEPVLTAEEVLADPDLAVSIRHVGGVPVVQPDVGAPGELAVPFPTPRLGAHNDEVLAAFGVPEPVVAAARAAGALAVDPGAELGHSIGPPPGGDAGG